MPAMAVSKTHAASAPPSVPGAYQSQARWAKPLPKPRVNAIPRPDWLAYNWIDKDPDLEFCLSAISESGMTLEQIERETEKNGHKVSRYTLMAWSYGTTKRPQNATISTVMRAIGWERPWVKQA